jgi:hypothetical protein
MFDTENEIIRQIYRLHRLIDKPSGYGHRTTAFLSFYLLGGF